MHAQSMFEVRSGTAPTPTGDADDLVGLDDEFGLRPRTRDNSGSDLAELNRALRADRRSAGGMRPSPSVGRVRVHDDASSRLRDSVDTLGSTDDEVQSNTNWSQFFAEPPVEAPTWCRPQPFVRSSNQWTAAPAARDSTSVVHGAFRPLGVRERERRSSKESFVGMECLRSTQPYDSRDDEESGKHISKLPLRRPPVLRQRSLDATLEEDDEAAAVELSAKAKVRATSAHSSRTTTNPSKREKTVSASAAQRHAREPLAIRGKALDEKPRCSPIHRLHSLDDGWSAFDVDRPPSRQKEAFPKHMDDEPEDEAVAPPRIMLRSSPRCMTSAARRRPEERREQLSHSSPLTSELEDSYESTESWEQRRVDMEQMHDPEADGFAALDELAPCPFKIQVTPNDGSPLQLKDLGAVAAKSSMRIDRPGEDSVVSATNNNLKTTTSDQRRSAKRRLGASIRGPASMRPESASPSTYHSSYYSRKLQSALPGRSSEPHGSARKALGTSVLPGRSSEPHGPARNAPALARNAPALARNAPALATRPLEPYTSDHHLANSSSDYISDEDYDLFDTASESSFGEDDGPLGHLRVEPHDSLLETNIGEEFLSLFAPPND